MKAIVVEAFGGPEMLKLADLERPVPSANELLVRVAVSGVNFTDVTARRGRPGVTVPFIPGIEAAGTVESVGDSVSQAKVGDRVAFIMQPNAYAEFVVIAADRAIPLPAAVDFPTAAALMMQGITAHYLSHEFMSIGPDVTALVHSAAGGVGLLLTQYATRLGAHVIGVTSSLDKAAIARSAGAREVIISGTQSVVDEVKRLTSEKGIDIIFDAVGRSTSAENFDAIATRGHIVVYGFASGTADPIVPTSLMPKAVTLSGGNIGAFTATRDELLYRANDVLSAYQDGWLKVAVDKTLPLAQAADAHRALESRSSSGKLLLIP